MDLVRAFLVALVMGALMFILYEYLVLAGWALTALGVLADLYHYLLGPKRTGVGYAVDLKTTRAGWLRHRWGRLLT